MGLEIKTLIDGVKELGLPIMLVLWFMYITTLIINNTKDSNKSIEKLHLALNELVKSTSSSFNNLMKQNNFMLNALSNMISGNKKVAKKMMDEAVIDVKEEEVKGGEDK